MSRPSARAALRVLFVVLATVSLIATAEGQAGTLRVSSDVQLIGIGGMSGGGHVTWTLTGDVARSLRQRIVAMFDEYAAIPRGFAYGGNGTTGNGDGIIQGGEALSYTNFLENEVEGVRYGYSGTEVRYVRIDRADLLEQGLPVNRSTDGLVGSGPTSIEPLQIRFIFNAETISGDYAFRFSDDAIAQALFRVFDLRQRQTYLFGDPWPVLQEGGWHSVRMTDGGWALWHGNDTTWTSDPLAGRYDNGTTSTARTSTEAGVPWLDLQSAASANVSFRYRGSVADPSDTLRLQVTTAPAYSTWSDLATTEGNVALPGAASWRSITYDLGPFIGQRIRLRLNFTADGANDASGFFVRDVEIRGPSSYAGVIESWGTDYLVGFHSFLDFDVRSGQVHLFRTPAGEVLIYSASYGTTTPPEAFARIRGFDLLENPQFLFIVLIAAAYSISASRRRSFTARRQRHWERTWTEAVEHRGLRWAARGLVFLLILLYLVPSVFTFVGGSILTVTGPVFLAIAVASAVSFGLAARSASTRHPRTAPPVGAETVVQSRPEDVLDPPPPMESELIEEFEPLPVEPQQTLACPYCRRGIEAPEEGHKCRCGQTYHGVCAAEIGRCTNCNWELHPLGQKMVTAKCPECGEIQVLSESTDLLQAKCEACGGALQGIDPGFSYLVLAYPPNPAWELFHSIVRRNVPGLAISPRLPEEMRKRFGLQGVELYHLTDMDDAPSSVDLKRLETEVFPLVGGFMRRRSGGVVILEGLEELVIANSFESVWKFLKKTSDLASVHEVTLLVPIAPGAFSAGEIERLRKEFDRTLNMPTRSTVRAAQP